MDLEQTQAIDFVDDFDDETDDEVDEEDKKPVAYLKVSCQKGFPEKKFPVYEGDNVIGRQEGGACNICIPLKALSREHACIEIRGETHCIYDKGSRNKTRRGKLVLREDVRYELKNNDDLKFGDVGAVYVRGKEANDGSDTEPEGNFQTAPMDITNELNAPESHKEVSNGQITNTVVYDEEESDSDQSVDLLQPTQAFPAENVTTASTLNFGLSSDEEEDVTKPDVTVKETPAVSRVKAISTLVLPESDTEDEEEDRRKAALMSDIQTQAVDVVPDTQEEEEEEEEEDKAVLYAATQAYATGVSDDDATTDEEGSSSKELLTAATQAFTDQIGEESNEGKECKRTFVADSDEENEVTEDDTDGEDDPDVSKIFAAPTLACDMEILDDDLVAETQAFTSKDEKSETECGINDATQVFTDNDCETSTQVISPEIVKRSNKSAKRVLSDADDGDTLAVTDGGTMAVSDVTDEDGEEATQVIPTDDATVAVSNEGATVAIGEDATVAVDETEGATVAVGEAATIAVDEREGATVAVGEDATMAVDETEGATVAVGEAATLAVDEEDGATMAIDGITEESDTTPSKQHRKIPYQEDSEPATQVIADEATMAVEDIDEEETAEEESEQELGDDCTQVIRDDNLEEAATQVIEDFNTEQTRTKAEATKGKGSSNEMNVSSDECTQVLTGDATVAVCDIDSDSSEILETKKPKSTRKKEKFSELEDNISEATQVIDEVEVDEVASKSTRKMRGKKAESVAKVTNDKLETADKSTGKQVRAGKQKQQKSFDLSTDKSGTISKNTDAIQPTVGYEMEVDDDIQEPTKKSSKSMRGKKGALKTKKAEQIVDSGTVQYDMDIDEKAVNLKASTSRAKRVKNSTKDKKDKEPVAELESTQAYGMDIGDSDSESEDTGTVQPTVGYEMEVDEDNQEPTKKSSKSVRGKKGALKNKKAAHIVDSGTVQYDMDIDDKAANPRASTSRGKRVKNSTKDKKDKEPVAELESTQAYGMDIGDGDSDDPLSENQEPADNLESAQAYGLDVAENDTQSSRSRGRSKKKTDKIGDSTVARRVSRGKAAELQGLPALNVDEITAEDETPPLSEEVIPDSEELKSPVIPLPAASPHKSALASPERRKKSPSPRRVTFAAKGSESSEEVKSDEEENKTTNETTNETRPSRGRGRRSLPEPTAMESQQTGNANDIKAPDTKKTRGKGKKSSITQQEPVSEIDDTETVLDTTATRRQGRKSLPETKSKSLSGRGRKSVPSDEAASTSSPGVSNVGDDEQQSVDEAGKGDSCTSNKTDTEVTRRSGRRSKQTDGKSESQDESLITESTRASRRSKVKLTEKSDQDDNVIPIDKKTEDAKTDIVSKRGNASKKVNKATKKDSDSVIEKGMSERSTRRGRQNEAATNSEESDKQTAKGKKNSLSIETIKDLDEDGGEDDKVLDVSGIAEPRRGRGKKVQINKEETSGTTRSKRNQNNDSSSSDNRANKEESEQTDKQLQKQESDASEKSDSQKRTKNVQNTVTIEKKTRGRKSEQIAPATATRGKKSEQTAPAETSKGRKSEQTAPATATRGRKSEQTVPADISNEKKSDQTAPVATTRGKKSEQAAPAETSRGRKSEKAAPIEKPGMKRKVVEEHEDSPVKKPAPGTPKSAPKEAIASPSLRRKSIEPNKAKVLFTGVIDALGQKTVKDLGGELVNSVYDCTHLVTDKARRTVKFLCCLSRGIPIVEPQWLDSCRRSGMFVDASPFLVKDAATEKQYKFSLQRSLDKASQSSLLSSYQIYATKSVKPEPSQMKDIIQCAGAKVLTTMPKKFADNTIVISCDDDKKLCDAVCKLDIPVVNAEFILTGILRQEVNLDAFTIFRTETSKKRQADSSEDCPPAKRKRR